MTSSAAARAAPGAGSEAARPAGAAFPRYEYKYTIPPRLMAPIQSFLRPYCELDPYAAQEPEGFYTVTTLYLDSDDFKTYRDKQGEAAVRYKLRVRTYGERGDGPVKFEIKRRFMDVFRKTRVTAPRENWPSFLCRATASGPLPVSPEERPALEDFLHSVSTLRARPKVLVRYERCAFVSRVDRYVRISFDRRLRFQPCRGYELSGKAGAWRAGEDSAALEEFGGQMILELKFQSGAPVWLLDLVRHFGLMRRGFSKYCFAVRAILGADAVSRELSESTPVLGVRWR